MKLPPKTIFPTGKLSEEEYLLVSKLKRTIEVMFAMASVRRSSWNLAFEAMMFAGSFEKEFLERSEVKADEITDTLKVNWKWAIEDHEQHGTVAALQSVMDDLAAANGELYNVSSPPIELYWQPKWTRGIGFRKRWYPMWVPLSTSSCSYPDLTFECHMSAPTGLPRSKGPVFVVAGYRAVKFYIYPGKEMIVTDLYSRTDPLPQDLLNMARALSKKLKAPIV